MITTYQAVPDIDVLTSTAAIPGLGRVPIDAFVLRGPEPILVDTGAVVERDEFMTMDNARLTSARAQRPPRRGRRPARRSGNPLNDISTIRNCQSTAVRVWKGRESSGGASIVDGELAGRQVHP
jgi:hypothetical protein